MTTHIVAGCLLDNAGRLLVVKSAGQSLFTLPGGAPSAQHGETPLGTLSRCCAPCLGQGLEDEQCIMLGRFRSRQDDTQIDADVFIIENFEGDATPGGEIETLHWMALDDDTLSLAPLLSDEVLPALRQRLD
ncbi:NUDIX domain-containing protein [Kushneria sp. TE3]|uniref:NUDIX domain-containing protein n=1 Tax=Kushneria sp. TE3 TaxID=3449832 RepID=UPI003F6889C9